MDQEPHHYTEVVADLSQAHMRIAAEVETTPPPRTTADRRRQRCTTCYGRGSVERVVTDKGAIVYVRDSAGQSRMKTATVPCACVEGSHTNLGHRHHGMVGAAASARGKHSGGWLPKGTAPQPAWLPPHGDGLTGAQRFAAQKALHAEKRRAAAERRRRHLAQGKQS